MSENTDVNANFLNADWWKTATVEDVKAEIAKGADVNAMNNITLDNAIERIMYLIYDMNGENMCTSNILDAIDIKTGKISELDKKINYIFSRILEVQIKKIDELDIKINNLKNELEKQEEHIKNTSLRLDNVCKSM